MNARSLVVWLLLLSTVAFGQTGTLFNPFTTLRQARTVERAGHYYFELGGGQTFFRTYVDEAGFVQIALEYGDDEPPAALPRLTSFANDARRGILEPEVLAALTGMTEVRMSSSVSGKLDVRTKDPGIIQRVLTNTTFKSDPADNAINLAWTGPGAQYLTAPATVANGHPVLTLDRIIVHTNGNGNGLHWVPYHDAQELTFLGSRNVPATEKWTLWVRGASSKPDVLGSNANPFTSLAQANGVSGAGSYAFNLDGHAFSTYVDNEGYVQIALEHGEDDPVTALPQRFVLADTARRGILPPAVLASLTEMTEVRMSSSVPNKLDARTTEPGIIQRILNNTTLKSDPADNGINRSWTGTGAQYLTADVAVGNQHPVRTLDRIIVHTTGNGNGMHWVPYHGAQELTYFGRTNVPSTEKWTVWVRGACENATAAPIMTLLPLRYSLCVEPTITVPPPTATDACGQVVTGTTTDATTFTEAGGYTVNWTFTGSNGVATILAQPVKVVGGASFPLPFYETAGSASASIDCWSTEGTESWRTTPDGGGRSFVVPTVGPSGRINRLHSPTFTLQAGMSYELSFTARGGDLEALRVELVGEGSPEGSGKQLFDDGALSSAFERSTLLFEPGQSGDYRIAFYNTGSGEAQQVYLDEIRLAPYLAPAAGGAGLLAATAEGDCTSSTGRGVSGAAWTRVYTADGRLLLDLNANGNDLGDVTVEMTEYATPPVAPFTGVPQLGRYFNIVPEHGSGPYTVNGGVRIRLYFATEELVELRSALGEDIDWPDLFVTHYRDAATDCDLLNSDGNDFELLPPTGDADFGGSARTLEFITTSFSEFGAATDGTTPVTLTAFTARGEGLQNLLEWSVATELDFSHYSVERSDDGRVYTELAHVEGSGLTDYSTLDAAPGRAAYYRLRLVDIDGSYAYGPIVSVFRTSPPEALLEAYPVPAAGRLVVRFRGVEAGPVDLRLTDALGRVVRSQHLASRRGMNTHTLDVSPLPSGTYHLTVRSSTSQQTVRIVRN